MNKLTAREKSTACEMCTLAAAMRDCPACQFDGGEHQRATKADVDAMFTRLWGNVPPSYVRMQWDAAQERGKELTDLCEGLQIFEAASVL